MLAAILAGGSTGAAAAAAPVLKGLVFLNSAGQLNKEGVAVPGDGVDVSRIPLLQDPDILAKLRQMLGQPISLPQLNELTPLVTKAYEAHQRPAVRVTIPEQDIDSGVVQVVVTEFRIGKITVEGNEYLPSLLVNRGFSLRPGDPVDSSVLAEDLRHLNRGQFRSIEPVLRPGQEVGTTDIVLQVKDRLPVSVSFGYNNIGVPSTGRNQWTGGVSVGNVAGSFDDVLSYQLLSTDFAGRQPALLTHTLAYDVDFPGIATASLTGIYSITRPPIGMALNDVGKTEQVSFRLSHDFSDYGNLQSSVLTGYDFKRTNNNIAFGGDTISSQFSDIDQFVLGVVGTRPDSWGQTGLSLTAFLSPGGVTSGNNNAAFKAMAPLASAQYAYGRAELTRTTTLPFDLSLWSHGVLQRASGDLLSSEQLTVGGPGTVRGFVTAATRGDTGFVVNNELRFPAVETWRARLEPYVFCDYAHVAAFTPRGRTSRWRYAGERGHRSPPLGRPLCQFHSRPWRSTPRVCGAEATGPIFTDFRCFGILANSRIFLTPLAILGSACANRRFGLTPFVSLYFALGRNRFLYYVFSIDQD